MILNVDFEGVDPTIITSTNLDIVFSEINTLFDLDFVSERDTIMEADFGEIHEVGNVELYEGPYEFTPNAKSEQIISTAKKYVENDITIEPIPYYEVSNTSDGLTVTIG